MMGLVGFRYTLKLKLGGMRNMGTLNEFLGGLGFRVQSLQLGIAGHKQTGR